MQQSKAQGRNRRLRIALRTKHSLTATGTDSCDGEIKNEGPLLKNVINIELYWDEIEKKEGKVCRWNGSGFSFLYDLKSLDFSAKFW